MLLDQHLVLPMHKLIMVNSLVLAELHGKINVH